MIKKPKGGSVSAKMGTWYWLLSISVGIKKLNKRKSLVGEEFFVGSL